MKRNFLLIVLLILTIPIMAQQSPPAGQFNTNSGTISTNYNISVVSTQSAVNLTSNPVDTHTLSWRPVGTVTTCQIQVDSSPDGINWTAAGVISSQLCTSSGSITASSVISNYIRVNMTVLTGGGTVTVIYGGRFAPVSGGSGVPPSNGGISNGTWVQVGDVIWFQYTTMGLGTVAYHQSTRILQQNGTISTNTWDIASCATGSWGTGGGQGTGFTVATSGWLQSAVGYPTTGNLPQGSVYVNIYILTSMPAGGNTTTCVNTMAASQIGTLLAGSPTGSFYPISFVGTSAINNSPQSVPGYTQTFAIGNPAAGSDWTTNIIASGAQGKACIDAVSFTLVTNGTVANRTVSVEIITGGAGTYYIASVPQPASTTVFYTFSPGASAIQQTLQGNIIQTVPFANGPPLCGVGSGGNFTVRSVSGGLQAGDQFSNVAVWTTASNDNN